MPSKKKVTAKTSFLHPISKKRVLKGSEISDIEGIPASFLVGVQAEKTPKKEAKEE